MRATFRDALESAGFETSVVADGETAIAAFVQLQPDLVLLDLIMPGKDGFETCRELRSMRGGEYTPALMVTGLGDAGSIRSAFNAGATDFITKPVNPDLLVYRVRYMLRASMSTKKLAKSEARLANAQRIARLGNCDEVQGFHLAMPMSAEDLVGNMEWPERGSIGGHSAVYS